MPAPEFSQLDAKNIVALAQNAPLRNLHEAQEVSKMLERFTAWYDSVTTPSAAPATTRKPRKSIEQPPSTETGPTAEDLTQ